MQDQSVNQNNQLADQSQGSVGDSNPQQVVSTGTPEASPVVTTAAETSGENQEFGYEAVKRLENSPESFEQKEAQKPSKIRIGKKKDKKKKDDKDSSEKKLTVMPTFFGYKVSPHLANNYQLIMDNKGKGDPHTARPWIMLMLDRLLKKQTVGS